MDATLLGVGEDVRCRLAEFAVECDQRRLVVEGQLEVSGVVSGQAGYSS